MRWPEPQVAGIVAMVGAIVLLIAAPFHAAAYFDTQDGSEDLFTHQEKGGEWMRDTFPAAFDFDTPYQVYKTYGIATSSALAMMAFGFLAFQGVQERRLTGWRRNTGRIAAGAWTVLALAALIEYTTPYTDMAFFAALPALLLMLVFTAIAGFAGARHGAAPAWMGRSLAASACALIPLVVLFGHLPMGAYAFAVTWLVMGRPLGRGQVAAPPGPGRP